jgi:hypothetical protein
MAPPAASAASRLRQILRYRAAPLGWGRFGMREFANGQAVIWLEMRPPRGLDPAVQLPG